METTDYQGLHAHLLDMLGAKDHKDAAKIIAGHHARELSRQSEGVSGEIVRVACTAAFNETGAAISERAMRAALTAVWHNRPAREKSEPVASGTFECPVCGFDKPHHHTEQEASIRWHSDYRKAFEEVVHKNLRLVRMQGLFFGRHQSIRLHSEGGSYFLGYSAEDARKYVGKEQVVGMPNSPWSEFDGGAPWNGGYKQPWLDDLWNIFKQFVIATRQLYTAPPAPPAERVRVPDAEPPLAGRWHHGNGHLCCGSFRVAHEDWEAGICAAENMREKVFDWICSALNAATPPVKPFAAPEADHG